MQKPTWVESLSFEEIDARQLEGFFLQKIVQTAQTLDQGQGLKIVQSFEPVPLYGVMEKEGWEHFTEKISEDEFHIFFRRVQKEEEAEEPRAEAPAVHGTHKVPVVIQSATPVVYPVLLRLLDSPEIKRHFDVREVKVWQETEKHLGWIVSGKADISFSAIIASANLLGKENDVKLATVTVWDNFYIVTRGYKAESLSDLQGKEIHMPLFRKAPPAQVTHYLLRQFGLNPDEFNFVYGEPFGRPEEIARKLINGEIDTALIREPEVSYALHAHPDMHVSFSYSDLWQQLRPESHGLPNAGLVFKGAFTRQHPELTKLFLRATDEAVSWVKANPQEAAFRSFREMGHSLYEVQLFLQRVAFENIPAYRVQNELRDYLGILEEKAARKILEKADELFLEESYFERPASELPTAGEIVNPMIG